MSKKLWEDMKLEELADDITNYLLQELLKGNFRAAVRTVVVHFLMLQQRAKKQ